MTNGVCSSISSITLQEQWIRSILINRIVPVPDKIGMLPQPARSEQPAGHVFEIEIYFMIFPVPDPRLADHEGEPPAQHSL